jgi:hypothetical protein
MTDYATLNLTYRGVVSIADNYNNDASHRQFTYALQSPALQRLLA